MMHRDTNNTTDETKAPVSQANSGRLKKPLRTFAVLFTDIVGSTKYFTDRGDIAGREMLQSHQDMVTTPVIEHGGLVVKTLGDSIMAYFTDPKDAVKSAIKIQQVLENYNGTKNQKDQIHVRVGIHYGDGIIEDQDIFGNVVNLAAKIVPVANQDQIFISQQVYDRVKNLSPVSFENVKSNGAQDDLKGIQLYRVMWTDTVQFDPSANILVYIKPHWRLADDAFSNIWENLRKEVDTAWKKRIVRKAVTKEKSLVLIASDASAAVTLAGDTVNHIRSHLPANVPYPLIPVQIAIDSGPYLRGDKLVLDNLSIRWEDFDPGTVRISASTLMLLKSSKTVHTDPLFDPENPLPYYRLRLDRGAGNESPLFLYQPALLQGNDRPCFYCGLRRHQSRNCPSKTIDEVPFALKEIGYLSIQQVNNLFYRFLTRSNSDFNSPPEDVGIQNETSRLTYHAFYELKSSTQLRLLRNLWSSSEDDWNSVQKKRAKGTRGGQAWLALDLIRTSQLSKAEKMLSALILEQSQDYHVNCIAGLMNVELKRLNKAEYHFDQALMFAQTRPQKMFILFLLCRLYGIQKKTPQIETKLKEILALYPYCLDARYLSTHIKFQNGQKEKAVFELTRLIQENGEYYGRVLIDPDLAPFMNVVQPALKKLYADAKEVACEVMPQAEEEMLKFENLLGGETTREDSLQASWEKTKDLFRTDSYLGYLDCTRTAQKIIQSCKDYVSRRKKRIEKLLKGLDKRCAGYLAYTKAYPYIRFSRPVYQALRSIQGKLDEAKRKIYSDGSPGKVLEAFEQVMSVSDEMDEISQKIKQLQSKQKAILFLSSFFKANLILQSINMLIGIILLPLLSHYILFISPKLNAFNHNLWVYQKGFLIVGGIFALLFSLIRPLKHSTPKTV